MTASEPLGSTPSPKVSGAHRPRQRAATGSAEASFQRTLVRQLRAEGWLVERVAGSAYMRGWPDLYCYHRVHGHRWVELKSATGRLRQTQVEKFSAWERAGVGVFVLRPGQGGSDLLGDANWRSALSQKSIRRSLPAWLRGR